MWHWLLAWYRWAVVNNLWRDVLTWVTGIVLNAAWAVRVWVRARRAARVRHAELLDRLDPETPGGIGEIARTLRRHMEEDGR
jgi:hypothetical protein